MTLAIDTQGTHPSTQLCLAALQWLQAEGQFAAFPIHVLDMGCGNGILSASAASVWDANVLAVDISEKALEDARQHIASHGLGDRITLLRSDGFAEPAILQSGPYDLVIANMLADWHIRHAKDLKNAIKPGGYGIMCGMLAWLAQNVKDSYGALGFEILKEFSMTPWTGIIVRKRS